MAVILPHSRPVLPIVSGSPSGVAGMWLHILDHNALASIRRVTPAVCKYGFVVGRDLVLTTLYDDANSHQWGSPRRLIFGGEGLDRQETALVVEAIEYENSELNVQLLRVNLPQEIFPLRLSGQHPSQLVGREIGVVGFPVFKSMLQFRLGPEANSAFKMFEDGSKALSPGKITGFGDEPRYPGRGVVLEHDATTAPGCAGGPVIDLKTGEVLGLHFAGEALRCNYAVSSWQIGHDRNFIESGVVFSTPVEPELDAGKDAPAAISSPLMDLERIVLSVGRPAIPIRSRTFPAELPERWESVSSQQRQNIVASFDSVLKVFSRASKGPKVLLGSAFYVGDRIVMTSNHVAAQFVDSQLLLRDGLSLWLEPFGADHTETSSIDSVLCVHPYFNLCLLRVTSHRSRHKIMQVSSLSPSDLAGREVAVLGVGGRLNGNDVLNEIYGENDQGLFFQPGTITQVSREGSLLGPLSIVHDCSTSSLASGSPLLDIESGVVMGLHYNARYLKAGFAVPLWEFARDPNVWEYGIHFRPNPKPEWMQLWNRESRTIASNISSHHEKQYDLWTDHVPIDWTKDSARRCEQRLSSVVSPEMLKIFMENIGIAYYVKASSSPKEIWRDALNTAANAAKLKLLIEEIANAEEYFAIRVDLLSLISSDNPR